MVESGLCKAEISRVACPTMCERQMPKLWFETLEFLPHGNWSKSFSNVTLEMLPRSTYYKDKNKRTKKCDSLRAHAYIIFQVFKFHGAKIETICASIVSIDNAWQTNL